MKNNLINRTVVFLLRKKFGLRKYQPFRFENQKSNTEHYYFTENALKKMNTDGRLVFSNVSLNWLLNEKCKIATVLQDTEAWI